MLLLQHANCQHKGVDCGWIEVQLQIFSGDLLVADLQQSVVDLQQYVADLQLLVADFYLTSINVWLTSNNMWLTSNNMWLTSSIMWWWLVCMSLQRSLYVAWLSGESVDHLWNILSSGL